MQVQETLNAFTDACRQLGKVELHHKQGHASVDELEVARAACVQHRADLILAISNEITAPAPVQEHDHAHDSSCGHTPANSVRTGLILIESFVVDDGIVMHMESHDGGHNPVTHEHAMHMMSQAALMLIEEMIGDE